MISGNASISLNLPLPLSATVSRASFVIIFNTTRSLNENFCKRKNNTLSKLSMCQDKLNKTYILPILKHLGL